MIDWKQPIETHDGLRAFVLAVHADGVAAVAFEMAEDVWHITIVDNYTKQFVNVNR